MKITWISSLVVNARMRNWIFVKVETDQSGESEESPTQHDKDGEPEHPVQQMNPHGPDPPGFSLERWWKTEQGSNALQNEILKYLYYRWKY